MTKQIINGRYQVESHLGRGSQGDVLLATDLKLGRPVALKLLRISEAFDALAEQSLRREAMVMARFHHANVVRVYDYDVSADNGYPFLVMEYLQGETLDRLSVPLSDIELRLMVSQVGDALQHAHVRGLVHRDLKPANLMLIERGRTTERFMILDLGIAKLTEVAIRELGTFGSMTFSGAGTPIYMSPEQALGEAVDHRADIYAMGSMIYEFLAGRAPFQTEADSLHHLLNSVATKVPEPLSRVSTRSFGRELEELIMQCLEKEASRRPDSMQDLVTRFNQSFEVQQTSTPISGYPVSTTPTQFEPELARQTTPPPVGREATSIDGPPPPPPQQPAVEISAEAWATSSTAMDDTGLPSSTASAYPRSEHTPRARRGVGWMLLAVALLIGGGAIAFAFNPFKNGAQVVDNGDDVGSNADPGDDDSNSTSQPRTNEGNGAGSPRSLGVSPQNGEVFEIPEDSQWNQQITFPDATTDVTYALWGVVPDGLSIDADSGQLAWRPTERQGPGSYDVSVRASGDRGATSQLDFSIRVLEVNRAPQVEPLESLSSPESQPIVFHALAQDQDWPRNELRFEPVGELPPGARLDSESGRFVWTPGEADGPGSFSIEIAVIDSAGGRATVQRTIEIEEQNSAPRIGAVGEVSVDEDERLELTLDGIDSDLPRNRLEFRLVGDVPEGARIDAESGQLTWQASEAHGGNNVTFEVQVSDNGTPRLSVEQSIEVAVKEINHAPVLSPIADQSISETDTLRIQLEANDSDERRDRLRFRLEESDLTETESRPSLDPDRGLLTWSPQEADGPGEFVARIVVTDDGTPPLRDEIEFRVDVSEVNQAPVFDSVKPDSIRAGDTFRKQISARDADVPANLLTYALDEGAPPGARLNPLTGTVTWPAELQFTLQTIRIPVRVSDDGGLEDRIELIIDVEQIVIDDEAGPEMILIPPGTFMRGSRDTPEQIVEMFPIELETTYENEHPRREVSISKPFFMARHEVTLGQFRRFVAATDYETDAEKGIDGENPFDVSDVEGATWKDSGHPDQTDDHPVTHISWNDAMAYCVWLSEVEGVEYRLPTQAEWEYACRARTTTRYWTGDDPESLVRGANIPDESMLDITESDDYGYEYYCGIRDYGREGWITVSAPGSRRHQFFLYRDDEGRLYWDVDSWEDITTRGVKFEAVNNSSDATLYVRSLGRQIEVAAGERETFDGTYRNEGRAVRVHGDDGFGGLAPVGQLDANPFGLFDMHGNVWEWCLDGYEDGGYPDIDEVDPRGPAVADQYVLRGACFL